ncbi:DUF6882 domain-containing protein [Corynebacterium pacaense]|uniref:DUF6882 domain-containing protein n=1 Tax=Corynebacterium pacaense TaxID=1816684 RepID=UPI0009BB3CD6|nr:DUF6882 domain-containing protein [Corynebacterium pacaense]
MELPYPTSPADVATDGVLAQSALDRAFSRELGRIDGVEFTIAPDSTAAQVRVHRPSVRSFDTTGEVVAWIRGDEFTWVSTRGEQFGIPELTGTQPLSDQLIAAARTLHGNLPAFIAPVNDERGRALVVLNTDLKPVDTRSDLIEGLSVLPEGTDVSRALIAFAAERGLGVLEEGNILAFSDGTSVLLRGGRATEISGGLSFADVRADAAFTSAEHQLLFDAVAPRAHADYDPRTGTALIDGLLRVSATALATTDDDVWRWAWADSRVPDSDTAGLRRFGFDNGLLPLVSPTVSTEQARQLNLIDVAKPVLHRWTHVIADSGEGFSVVLLIDHPRLHLPPASRAAAEATLHTPLAREIDGHRAVSSYAAQRGLAFDGEAITVEGHRVGITFNGKRISGIS